ncbi:MAG: omega-6 fatty acid desaturase (delta-12 desaturase) [Phormidesmis priestleyi Ana]|uniref:Omega-6 fatty acid desaturase (Delta-12 desaturase) n=1 Tax=Phormidesmis priestleyi Ana TaxID=1666911 RepID=A0A0P8BJ24_9CYAN|nr:MAG: omega-6 fatty acid desaturase (delta-12 desaturase) [Phormidesmis priestleyi Ana]
MTATTERFVAAEPKPNEAPLQLKEIVRSIPKAYFEKDAAKAWKHVAISISAVIAGYCAIIFLPSFLLPFTWFFTGTALTGFFVVGHDAGHRSFAKRRWVNDVVGHIAFLPLIYPFHPWRILHDHHHLHTNKIEEDNAWYPWYADDFARAHPAMKVLYKAARGWFWWLGSIGHWAVLHFDLRNFKVRDRSKALFSMALVVGFAAIFFPVLIATTGFWGFVKFWLIPWMVYHFWMSTFTIVHHTIPEISFQPEAQWSAGDAQLAGTVHCSYPRWIEFLCHDINVHVPHHVSTGIPSYHLRAVHANLKENWGEHIVERKFNWALIKSIATECHLYHPEKSYQSFKEAGF